MRQFVRSLPVVVAVAAIAVVGTLKSQDGVARPQETWEYATVVAGSMDYVAGDSFRPMASGTAQICFASKAGCRYETVRVTNEMPRDVSSPASYYNQAIASAAARLGAEGWELTNTLGVNQDGGTNHVQMYFRKPSTVRE